jgi:hypothetical protein
VECSCPAKLLRTPSGVQVGTWNTPVILLIKNSGVLIDSTKTPEKLHGLLVESRWTPDGLHQDVWLSVKPSNGDDNVVIVAVYRVCH